MPKCKSVNCKIRPGYGKSGSKLAEFCKTHAPSDYVNVVSKTCKTVNCKIQPKYGIPGYTPEYCTTHKKPGMIYNFYVLIRAVIYLKILVYFVSQLCCIIYSNKDSFTCLCTGITILSESAPIHLM